MLLWWLVICKVRGWLICCWLLIGLIGCVSRLILNMVSFCRCVGVCWFMKVFIFVCGWSCWLVVVISCVFIWWVWGMLFWVMCFMWCLILLWLVCVCCCMWVNLVLVIIILFVWYCFKVILVVWICNIFLCIIVLIFGIGNIVDNMKWWVISLRVVLYLVCVLLMGVWV